MIRLTRLLAVSFFAALMGLVLTPARAATLPTGAAILADDASRISTEQVQYRRAYRGRPVYRRAYYRRPVYRRAYYGRPVYRPARVYRRCWTQPRVVWTPYGYVRRWVRVCR